MRLGLGARFAVIGLCAAAFTGAYALGSAHNHAASAVTHHRVVHVSSARHALVRPHLQSQRGSRPGHGARRLASASAKGHRLLRAAVVTRLLHRALHPRARWLFRRRGYRRGGRRWHPLWWLGF